MKKGILFALALCLMLALAVTASAEVVNVTAITDITPTYNKIAAVFVEYSEEIQPMKAEDFYAIDYRTADMKEDYDRSAYGLGVITAIYTNSEAAITAEKTDVPGKFLVMEFQPCTESYYNEEEQLWKTNNNFGVIAGRSAGEKSAHYLTEGYEDLVIAQLRDAVNANGDVVAAAGLLPSLTFDEIADPVYKAFELAELTNDRGYPVFFAYHLPENYDAAKSYDLAIYLHGGGGRCNYEQTDAEGNYVTRTQFTRDTVAARFVEYGGENTIVLCPQYWRNAPWEEDGRQDDAADVHDAIQYMFDNFNINREHVIMLGSSQGTAVGSEMIQRFPGTLTGYCQSNGSYMLFDENWKSPENLDRVTMYKVEDREATIDWSVEDFWAYYRSGKPLMDASEYLEQSKAGLQTVIDQGLKVYFVHGVNDETGSCITAVAPYMILCDMYREMGKTEAEINDLVRLTLISSEEYREIGVNEYHEAHRFLMETDEAYNFLMGK